MKYDVVNSLALVYQFLLQFYPRHFREEFGPEMTAVFMRTVREATASNGRAVVAVCLRELRDIPQALAGAYRYDWIEKWQEGIQLLRAISTSADLPPPPPDGRESWRQVGLELSLFLVAGLLLIGVTYLPFAGPSAGWGHDLGFLGKIIMPLTLAIFLIGLALKLPRWAYPFGGLLLGYQALRINQSGIWPFLVVMLLAYAILGVVALITNPQPSPLPVPLRRIGQSLALDWTRLSFGVYGAAPLAIIIAFDDGHTNGRTPYLALSVLAMIGCALIYCRSGQRRMQVGALLGGMTFFIMAAWLDNVSFTGGSGDWIAVPAPGHAEIVWLLGLWIHWMYLILAPVLLSSAGRTVRLERAI
jgi:Na+-transporting methylmalonyl-CoA/oxaloacetate decarboxylase gamma subunit